MSMKNASLWGRQGGPLASAHMFSLPVEFPIDINGYLVTSAIHQSARLLVLAMVTIDWNSYSAQVPVQSPFQVLPPDTCVNNKLLSINNSIAHKVLLAHITAKVHSLLNNS